MIDSHDKLAKELEVASKPLIEFINKNFHPHAKVIVDCSGAELLEGCMFFVDENLVVD